MPDSDIIFGGLGKNIGNGINSIFPKGETLNRRVALQLACRGSSSLALPFSGKIFILKMMQSILFATRYICPLAVDVWTGHNEVTLLRTRIKLIRYIAHYRMSRPPLQSVHILLAQLFTGFGPLPPVQMAITQPPEIDDHIAALTYQLAEIQIYGENEKGKYPLGCPSDTKLANDESEAEIQTYIEYLNDLKLAISIANAVATDSDVISELIEHERITQWDHEYAARIDDRSIHSNQSEIKQHLSLCDFISNVLADGINDEGCAGPSMTYAERQAKALDKLQEQCQCCVCFESFQATSVPPLPCGDRYCADCLRTLFQNASRDETLFPPRCCRLQIPLENIEHELSREEIRFFLNAEVEFSTENRVYCSNTECAQFIHPQNIQAERALCPACATDTCTACKARYHGRSECLEDPELEATMALAEEQGWQRCYSCRALVELKHGCNHMT